MKNTVKILQGISRILLLVVGLALISGSLFFTGVHMANKNVTKTETQGVIVRGDEALKEVNYTFEGVSHQVRPLDTYFRNLGTVDTKIKIYVDNEHPERIFLTYRGDGLKRTAGILAGWGLLLLVILLGERQLMSRMKKLEQLAEEEKKKHFLDCVSFFISTLVQKNTSAFLKKNIKLCYHRNMTILHNKISNKELKERLEAETEPRTTISFYKYFNIADPQEFRDNLYMKFEDLKVFGRVYIAKEGINAQISVPTPNLEKFKTTLYQTAPELDGLRLNYAIKDDGKSFWVLRMKVRNKIVADGIDDPTFDPSDVGQYLKAEEVNEMLGKEDTIFVDMRNHYEYEVGHFKDVLEVPSATFREQLPMAADMLKDDKDKNIVMYCTGGIRCEKASAFMKHEGFENVYHVEGGIIEYARKAKEQDLPIEFIGKNFVFDERMGERITDDVLSTCPQCGEACDMHTNCKNKACHRLFIQCENCAERFEGCCSQSCVEELSLSDEEINALIAERAADPTFFTKGRS